MSEKKVAILQSNYLPWKGYFDLIAYVDEFIIFDDMQFTKRDWRNRNKLKTPQGSQWITVPVLSSGKYHQEIRHTKIDGEKWKRKHLASIELNYKKSPYVDHGLALLTEVFDDTSITTISELNVALIKAINNYLDIQTTISFSWNYPSSSEKSVRLAGIAKAASADVYVSGPAAKDYLDESTFKEEGLRVEWFHYDGYEPYEQLWGEFDHYVTVLDLIMNQGSESPKYLQFTKDRNP